MKLFTYLFFLTFFIVGCSQNVPTPQERKATALSLGNKYNLKEQIYSTKEFDIFSLQTDIKNCKNIKVYIEGDGLAWISRNRISKNPTPINPLGLKLMNMDNSSCKIYLARPCQYLTKKNCDNKYWTSHRFSNIVIQSYDEVLNNVNLKYDNTSFTLIGYSGGGAIVALIAAKRDDINKLITIAGNLNPTKWVDIHNIYPLNGSLNPIDYTSKLENIKQYHLIGKNDRIIPKEIFFSYKSKFHNKTNIKYKIYDASHSKGWEKSYKEFLKDSILEK
ncbi:MAG: alpha/beta hydrolase [Arcobacter sp.]|uniref:alpha/beta hydrolase n=1 Tax=Arcobacter sp. TaxID=1872629 RepID=UPI003C765614